MAYNGPARFYIVYTKPGFGAITTSDYVLKSPFAIIERDWSQALPEFVQKYPNQAESLELDCHGSPGTIYLQPEITTGSLPAFAAALRGLLRANPLIEVLACRVANYPVRALIAAWQGIPTRKADVEFLTAWLDNTVAHEGGRGAVALINPGAKEVPKPPKPPSPVILGDTARVARLAIEYGQVNIGNSPNGPLFCSQMARCLGGRVRAAMASQPAAMTSGMGLCEFLNTPDYRVMPIGNWAGHVFEFSPNGSVTYLGENVSRPVYMPFTPGIDGPLRYA